MHRYHHKAETAASLASAKSPSEVKVGTTPGVNEQVQKSKSKSQEIVRVRAHQKWEAAGRPSGDGVKFWLEAEQELLRAK
jgi:Protein of unknown function (DUF2934)